MLAINDQQKFNCIVKDALIKSSNYPRWQNAINKAVVQIELNGDFMTYDASDNHLVAGLERGLLGKRRLPVQSLHRARSTLLASRGGSISEELFRTGRKQIAEIRVKG